MCKKTIRFLVFLVVMVLTVSVFAGCGGTDSNNEQSSSQQETATAAPATSAAAESTVSTDKYAPQNDKTYEISYLTMGYALTDENCDILKKYNETFNVKIKPVFVEPAKWDDLLNIKLASGEIPDVFPAKSADKLIQYQGQGLLAEIPRDTIKLYAPDLVNTIEADAPTAWRACTVEGKNYGIPYIVSTYRIRHPLVWRTDWLANVGITKTPDTIAEFEEAFTKFTNDDPDKNGKKDTYGLSNTVFESVFGAYGIIVDQWWGSYFLEKDNKIVYSAIEPAAKEVLALLNKWYKAGLIDPEFITGENKGGYWAVSSDFVNGRIGASGMGYYYHWTKPGAGIGNSVNYDELMKINANATYEFGLPPLGPDGTTRYTGQDAVAGGVSYVFSSALDKDPGKIGRILQMFNWPEEDINNWIFNVLGTEGKTYYIKPFGDGAMKQYKQADEYNDPAKASQVGLAQFFYEVGSKASAAINEPFFKQAEKDNMLKYGIQDQYFNVVMPSYATSSTDLSKLLTETYVRIITGEQPISAFDDFVKTWKANGGDQLLKEANDFYAKSQAK